MSFPALDEQLKAIEAAGDHNVNVEAFLPVAIPGSLLGSYTRNMMRIVIL
jgi:hypothetical protein